MSRFVTGDKFQQIPRELGELGIRAIQVKWPEPGTPDFGLYQPYIRRWAVLSPWLTDPRMLRVQSRVEQHGTTLLAGEDHAWVLFSAFLQTQHSAGAVWEAGVYQGGSSLLLRHLIEESLQSGTGHPTVLRLFDSFEGMPPVMEALDTHRPGDFTDTSIESVQALVGTADWIDFRKGWIPETFTGLTDSRIRLAHVDVDLYQSVRDCCEFIYPRLVPGGIVVFDDYGPASCPGARRAVDEFFRDRPETPFVFMTGQCMVVRHCRQLPSRKFISVWRGIGNAPGAEPGDAWCDHPGSAGRSRWSFWTD